MRAVRSVLGASSPIAYEEYTNLSGYNRGVARVRLIRYDDGSQAFAMGEVGEPFVFEPGDEDSVTIAFSKAVNDGIERGETIEGDSAIQVAAVLKEVAAGQVVWDSEYALNDWRSDLCAQLPKQKAMSGEMCDYSPFYIEDVSLDGTKVLICGYEGGESYRYVAAVGRGTDGEPVLAPKDEWVTVAQQYVAAIEKAGRMFSGKNLSAMQEAHERLGALIAMANPKAADDEEEPEPAAKSDGPAMSYTVSKATGAMRYTLGPLYAPMRKDAHGEFIEDDTLHKSLHEFVRDSSENGRKINLQHGDKGDVQVGEWVEAVRWPYDHVIKMLNADGDEHEVEMPAGTVYLGVVWDEDYWDVKKNAPKGLNGYSLGGRAVKVQEDAATLKDMGYKVRKSG
jgi:hypothetical protein